MQCSKCGHENRSGAKFCEECATPLTRTCANCGSQLSATAKFCPECAHPATTATAGKGTLASAGTYTPRHLAEKILNSKATLEGERKQVTVLLADLKGSMELLAERDPEEARKLLDPVLERMMEAVHRYEGTVNQVMGDGIMALFGAPIAHEDHAVRACYAALRMQELVNRYANDARHAHGVNVQIRVGLNSGEVVVRAIGSDLHMDYTAVGQTTHLAGRMEQLASPGSILLTPVTLELVEGYIAAKSLGSVPVKGLADRVEVYEVTGAGPARTRLQAAAGRGLTRFVGRDAELEQLRRAQQLANDGHGQVAAIVGEAGVGKSRLLYEFTHSHRLQGWLVLESASVSYGKATSYLPVIDLLKGYFRIQDQDDRREIRAKVTGKLLTLDESLKPMLSPLLSLLDVPVDDAAWQAMDPPQRRQRMLDAVKRLLLREAREQPLLVIFEDLHWIDSETQVLLDGLVESLGSAPLLLLVNYRPEYQHTWGSKTYYSQMRLDALPAESAGELLEALLGDDSGLTPLKQLLVRRGNPFFLEETIRTLVETKALAGEGGRYRLTEPLQAIQVPATVQTMLAARIDRLSPEDKRLLQTASVVGKDVPWVLLQTIADLSDEALRGGIDHLLAAEFLYETGLYPDLEYSFKHALTHEVTYGGLLQERRRELHARIVHAIETLYRDRLEEHIERLAHHAVRGELQEKAVQYLRKAGLKAAARSAHREAVASFERALEALHHLPESRETLGLAVDLRFDLRSSLFPLGELKTMLESLREAERLARALDDQQRIGWALAYLSECFRATGNLTDGRRFAQSAWAVAETLGEFSLQIVANFYMGTACLFSGDVRRSADLFRKIAHSLEGDRTPERHRLAGFPAVMSRSHLAMACAHLGAFDEGITQGLEGVRIAEVLDHPFSLAFACHNLAELYSAKGEHGQAITLAERGLALCRDWNFTLFSPVLMRTLGLAYASSGQVVEGVSWLQRAATAHESMGRGLTSMMLVQLGEAYLLADQVEDARVCVDRALTPAREHGERGNEAWALCLLGEVASHHNHPDVATAKTHYGAATALASELGMRPLVARCHLGLGKLYQLTGEREQAKEHLIAATTMYRDMSMEFWLQRAEAEMRQLG